MPKPAFYSAEEVKNSTGCLEMSMAVLLFGVVYLFKNQELKVNKEASDFFDKVYSAFRKFNECCFLEDIFLG
jgi:hypothetical protein